MHELDFNGKFCIGKEVRGVGGRCEGSTWISGYGKFALIWKNGSERAVTVGCELWWQYQRHQRIKLHLLNPYTIYNIHVTLGHLLLALKSTRSENIEHA